MAAMFFPVLAVMSALLLAQATMIPAKNGTSCPSGTQYAGSGYCRIKNGKQYIPAKNGTSCPSGSMYSGAGYCKVR
mgnify:FL=1